MIVKSMESGDVQMEIHLIKSLSELVEKCEETTV